MSLTGKASGSALATLEGRLEKGVLGMWHQVLTSGVSAQRIVSDGVIVGGSAAAMYAGHRISLDIDQVHPNLRVNFDGVLERLEQASGWRTERIRPPVLILGTLHSSPVGFRQSLRKDQIESVEFETTVGILRIPTLSEMIRIKAFLSYYRNATRDYLDFAALAACAEEGDVKGALLEIDKYYGHLQSASVAMEVSKALIRPAPYDLEQTNLREYKALATQWQDWNTVVEVCNRFGLLLGKSLVEGELS